MVLELRRRRREEKRLYRNEGRRSTMRASTLKTETDILQREKAEKDNPNRKGRRAQHETGEIRVKTKMTQAELIEQALEEEERNKEALRDWLRKEEERRELRRVGRKRVRGPRWTWISRTVGKFVEVVDEDASTVAELPVLPSKSPAVTQEDDSRQQVAVAGTVTLGEQEENGDQAVDVPLVRPPLASPLQPIQTESPPKPTLGTATPHSLQAPSSDKQVVIAADDPTTSALADQPTNANTHLPPVQLPPPSTGHEPDLPSSAPPPSAADTTEALTGPYMRNYLILSDIPGGLAEELKLVLGNHVEWDQVQFIPHRNRPIGQSFSSTDVLS